MPWLVKCLRLIMWKNYFLNVLQLCEFVWLKVWCICYSYVCGAERFCAPCLGRLWHEWCIWFILCTSDMCYTCMYRVVHETCLDIWQELAGTDSAVAVRKERVWNTVTKALVEPIQKIIYQWSQPISEMKSKFISRQKIDWMNSTFKCAFIYSFLYSPH
jgi:hypothetical protein